MRQRHLWAAVGSVLLLTVGAAWLGGERRDSGGGAFARVEGTVLEDETRREVELVPATAVAPDEARAESMTAESSAEPRASGGATRSSGKRKRGTIRGRLWIAGTEEPLAESLAIRVRSGDLSRKELVRSGADGTFVTEQAFPRGNVLATVIRPAGDDAAEFEGWFDPARDEEWAVRIPWPTFARGRLVDRRGEPVADVELRLSAGASTEAPARGGTGSSGQFRLQVSQPGPCRLLLCRGFERFELRLDLARGPNELGDVITAFERDCRIAGTIVAEDHSPRAQLKLENVVTGATQWTVAAAEDDARTAAFDLDVAPGEYRIDVVGRDGDRYAPADVRVHAPATELVFRSTGEAETFLPTVRAAEPAARPLILLRLRGEWTDADGDPYPRAEVERWAALARGSRPLFRDAPRDGEHALAPGFGCAFMFVEESGADRGRPVGDVAVLADGREVARSGTDGFALVDLDAQPATITFHARGWRVVEGSWRPGELRLIALVPD